MDRQAQVMKNIMQRTSRTLEATDAEMDSFWREEGNFQKRRAAILNDRAALKAELNGLLQRK
jgi:hypothetical protein